MAMTVHQHPDLSTLVNLLADHLRRRPEGFSALETQPLIVQTPGMARWVALECARLNGSFVRVEALKPVQFIMRLGFLVLGQREERTLFEKDVLPWALYRLLRRDIEARVPAVAELARYVAESEEEASVRLFALATTLADLFDQYLLYRPEWLESWEHDKLLGSGRPEEVWQAHLWRQLQEQAGDTPTRADFHQRLTSELKVGKLPEGVPRRVFLFGMSLLPPRFLEVFSLLGENVEVELFLQQPSLQYWGDLETDRRALKQGRLGKGNRLLAYLGSSGKEFQDLLLAFPHHSPDSWDWSEFPRPVEPTLLQALQDDLLWCHDPRDEPEYLTEGDRSLRFARCPSMLREVEVLHDLLLDALADIPGLTPSEILVISPEPGRYAPLIQQTFSIPFTLADQSVLEEDHVVRLATELLEASNSAFSPSLVVPLFERAREIAGEPLEAREHDRLVRWVIESGIRRGWDSPVLSWQAGLDRLFSGFTFDGTDPDENGLFPVEAGWGTEAQLLGPLASFLRSLAALAALKDKARPFEAWVEAVFPLLKNLLSPLERLEKATQKLREQLGLSSVLDDNLSWSLFLSTLTKELSLPSSGSFLQGRTTVCGMVPMRSLPFRVIAVLGLNQGVFPRASEQPEYDLMRGTHQPGDRDLLESDRFLFLELLASAKDRLIFTSCGLQDGEARPPSSVLETLLSWLDTEYRVGETKAGEAITVDYPLHPGSRRYLSARVEDKLLSTWGTQWFEVRLPAAPASRFWDWRALFTPDFHVEGKVLLRRLCDPLKAFWDEGLRASPERREDLLPETELFRLVGLSEFVVRDAALEDLQGDAHALARLEASGGLPPGRTGEFLRERVVQSLRGRWARAQALLQAPPVFSHLAFSAERDGFTFAHEAFLATAGDLQLLLEAGKVKPKRLLAFYLAHAFANLQTPTTTVMVALDDTRELPAWGPQKASENLRNWKKVADLCVSQPLPFTLEALEAYFDNPGAPQKERLEAAFATLHQALGRNDYAPAWSLNSQLMEAFGDAKSYAEAGVEPLFCECAELLKGLFL
jgi:exodeoxyribonuclease V gamma subunit